MEFIDVITERYSVRGYLDKEVEKEKLERDKLESSIYIMVNDLKYLKKGGRVTTAGALIASVMNLKPVLQIIPF